MKAGYKTVVSSHLVWELKVRCLSLRTKQEITSHAVVGVEIWTRTKSGTPVLSSVKDEFAHIATHYGIATSTAHSELTSQECHKCGYTDPSNRVTQEDFECQECRHVENADSNASKVIRSRISKAVLRDALLAASKIGNGTFEPKAFRHWKVKEILLSLRYKAYPPPLVPESRESAICL